MGLLTDSYSGGFKSRAASHPPTSFKGSFASTILDCPHLAHSKIRTSKPGRLGVDRLAPRAEITRSFSASYHTVIIEHAARRFGGLRHEHASLAAPALPAR